ncbi:MAG: DUF4091 domain-containing protein, partial [Kiritimatiellae bacterium]|nr:DUF4091 domain-containing protein [Kiritimatiellia bacterium]
YSTNVLKTYEYESPDDSPIVFSVRSRAEKAEAQLYCAYLDVHYADGTHDWNKKARFNPGTHGWERATGAFVPKKPVSKLELYGIFRDGVGKVEFDGHSIERREGTNDVLEVQSMTDMPYSDSDVTVRKVFNGREVKLVTERTFPSLLKEKCPLQSGEFQVWTCGSLETVTPLAFPKSDARRSISIDLARREGESAQVLISSGSPLENVSLVLGELKDVQGRRFKGQLKWERVGYIARGHGFYRHAEAPPIHERWLPGPLLPAAPFKVRAASTQGTWITVTAAEDEIPGEYNGVIRVSADGRMVPVPISVNVRNFSLPKRFGMRTAFCVMDGFTRKYYPEDFASRKRESWDMMLDHRLNPDDISRTEPPDVDDLLYARKRGMNSFNILNIVPPAKPGQIWVPYGRPEVIFAPGFFESFTNRLAATVERLRRHGLIKDAYIYGFDERGPEYYDGIDVFWKRWKAAYPDIPLVTTSRQFKDYVRGDRSRNGVLSADIFCPIIQHFDFNVSEELKKSGKGMWWYSCCFPEPPLPNFGSYENPLWEGRLLVGWLTWRYRLQGFLFWIVNRWDNGNSKLDENETFFPGWKENELTGRCPGDGTFMYPGLGGILPSVRLSMLRDAVEDYEYQLLDGTTETPFNSLVNYPRNPQVLLEARSRVADRLEKAIRDR